MKRVISNRSPNTPELRGELEPYNIQFHLSLEQIHEAVSSTVRLIFPLICVIEGPLLCRSRLIDTVADVSDML
jgi:hypothetical protein